jgi:hypothetical protein
MPSSSYSPDDEPISYTRKPTQIPDIVAVTPFNTSSDECKASHLETRTLILSHFWPHLAPFRRGLRETFVRGTLHSSDMRHFGKPCTFVRSRLMRLEPGLGVVKRVCQKLRKRLATEMMTAGKYEENDKVSRARSSEKLGGQLRATDRQKWEHLRDSQ